MDWLWQVVQDRLASIEAPPVVPEADHGAGGEKKCEGEKMLKGIGNPRTGHNMSRRGKFQVANLAVIAILTSTVSFLERLNMDQSIDKHLSCHCFF